MIDHTCYICDGCGTCPDCLKEEIARLRAALREIAECPCHNPAARDCRTIDDPRELWCPVCIARAALSPGGEVAK